MNAGVIYPRPNKCKAPISSLIVTFVSDSMYPSFPTQCSFVGLLDDTSTSRNQSILEKKTASHKEGLDTFQSMLEGMANAGTDVTYLKAAVTQYIRRFPDRNSAKVKDAIVDETDVLYSELNNNILLRGIMRAPFEGSWNSCRNLGISMP